MMITTYLENIFWNKVLWGIKVVHKNVINVAIITNVLPRMVPVCTCTHLEHLWENCGNSLTFGNICCTCR